MSTFNPIEVACPACNAKQMVTVPESANVQRQPDWRDKVLQGTFMRSSCERCGEPFVIERELLYTDLDAGVFIGVFPEQRRDQRASCVQAVEQAFHQAVGNEAPAAVRAGMRHVQPRVCFGYTELREKVLCFHAGLDDRMVEALKLALIPGLVTDQAEFQGLVLVAVEDDGSLIFIERPNGTIVQEPRFVRVQRPAYDELKSDRARIETLLPPLFADAYVNASTCLT